MCLNLHRYSYFLSLLYNCWMFFLSTFTQWSSKNSFLLFWPCKCNFANHISEKYTLWQHVKNIKPVIIKLIHECVTVIRFASVHAHSAVSQLELSANRSGINTERLLFQIPRPAGNLGMGNWIRSTNPRVAITVSVPLSKAAILGSH